MNNKELSIPVQAITREGLVCMVLQNFPPGSLATWSADQIASKVVKIADAIIRELDVQIN